MAFNPTFVFAGIVDALKHAFFKAYAQMVRTRSQSAFANRKLARHLPVMLDFLVSLVQMVIKNEFLFVPGQKVQTL